jgi:hypothetical protein
LLINAGILPIELLQEFGEKTLVNYLWAEVFFFDSFRRFLGELCFCSVDSTNFAIFFAKLRHIFDMAKLLYYYFLKQKTLAVGRFFDFLITSSSKNFWLLTFGIASR